MAGMNGAAVPFTLVVVAFLSQGCTIGGGGGGGGGGGSDPNHDFEFNAFELLSQHNKHRCEHGVPLLTYSDIIAKNAQAWANTIAPQMEHSSFDSRSNIAGHWMLGENLFMGKSHMEGVVDAWYDEIRYTKNGLVSSFGHDTGHYTQVVWKETRELGCAKVGPLLVLPVRSDWQHGRRLDEQRAVARRRQRVHQQRRPQLHGRSPNLGARPSSCQRLLRQRDLQGPQLQVGMQRVEGVHVRRPDVLQRAEGGLQVRLRRVPPSGRGGWRSAADAAGASGGRRDC